MTACLRPGTSLPGVAREPRPTDSPVHRSKGPADKQVLPTMFVLLCDGRTQIVPGYRGLRLTGSEMIVLGDGAFPSRRRVLREPI